MKKTHSKRNGSGITPLAAGILIGGAVGAVAALLLTSKKEHGFREEVADLLSGFKKGRHEPSFSSIAGDLLNAVSGLLLNPKIGGKFKNAIGSYYHVSDKTYHFINNMSKTCQEIAELASEKTVGWAERILDLTDHLIIEVKEWASVVKEAAEETRTAANKHHSSRLDELILWADRATEVADAVLHYVREWVEHLETTLERESIDRRRASVRRNGESHSIPTKEIVEFVILGANLWKNFKRV